MPCTSQITLAPVLAEFKLSNRGFLKKLLFGFRFFFVIVFYATLYALFLPIDREALFSTNTTVVYSQEGYALRTLLKKKDSSYQHSLSLEEIPEQLIAMIIQEEDKNFYWHSGVDAKGVLRAAWQNIRYNRIISGASTISMQLARVLFLPKRQNIWVKKFLQSYWAVRLENNFTKKELLRSYFNHVPLPQNCLGVSCFASSTLQKRVDLLSPIEMATTTALIKEHSPSLKNLRKRVYRIFLKHFHSSFWDEKEFNIIAQKVLYNKSKHRITSKQLAMAWRSPHFIAWMNEKNKNLSTHRNKVLAEKIRTTISSQLSETIENIIANEIVFVEKYNSMDVAVVVLEKGFQKKQPVWNLRAMIGSKQFDKEDGENNGALAVRQAGSTLKPFLYALSFDFLSLRPWQRIDDIATSFYHANFSHIVYKPKNYDLNYWGDISIAEALATSRNIPAVEILMRLGIKRFYQFLKTASISDLPKQAEFYGPGIALGNSGAHLLGLTRAYGILASQGKLLPVYYGQELESKEKATRSFYWGKAKAQPLLSKNSCLMISEILSNNRRRKKSFGNRSFLDFPYKVAVKTGTSKDYVDSWTIGYNDRYVVGVWLGNFSGEKMNRVSGAYGAGRIFHQVFRYLQEQQKAKLTLPIDKGWNATEFCFHSHNEKDCATTFYYVPASELAHVQKTFGKNQKQNQDIFLSPMQGEQFILDPHIPLSAQKIPVRLQLPQKNCDVFLDNNQKLSLQVSSTGFAKSIITPLQGRHTLSLYCENQFLKQTYYHVLNSLD